MDSTLKRRLALAFFLIILLIVYIIGCATGPEYVTEYRDVVPPFDNTFIKNIAVIEFSNSSTRTGAGKIMADRLEQMLLKEGPYKVVNRMELDKVLTEHKLLKQGFLDPETAKKIGKLTGADALVVGNVETFNYEVFSWTDSDTHQTYLPGDKPFDPRGPAYTTYTTYYKKSAKIVVTLKVLNTETGDIAWSYTADGDWWAKGDGAGVAAYSEYDIIENAIISALYDMKWLYPHRRAFKKQVN